MLFLGVNGGISVRGIHPFSDGVKGKGMMLPVDFCFITIIYK